MTEYGSGGSFSVTMDGPFGGSGGGTTTEKLITIYTSADKWKGGTSPFTQVVEVDGININTKVDLQLSAQQLDDLSDQTITFVAENDSGVVTVYAIGDKPESDCEFQATLNEVVNVTGDNIIVIRGNTVSTTMPRADYSQEDETKADYILNKPNEKIDEALTKARAALPKSGGTMTGVLNMGKQIIEDLAEPTKDHHAATQLFVKNFARNTLNNSEKVSVITLDSSKWNDKKITVEAEGVISDSEMCMVIVSADPEEENYLAYCDANVRAISQGEGTLTFACIDIPEKNLTVYVRVRRAAE